MFKLLLTAAMRVKDAVFEEILDKVLFREKQVSNLLNQFNTRNSFSCGSIFIYGHTAILKRIMSLKFYLKNSK